MLEYLGGAGLSAFQQPSGMDGWHVMTLPELESR
jgi:hypothetical protein